MTTSVFAVGSRFGNSKSGHVAVTDKTLGYSSQVGLRSFLEGEANPTLKRFNEYWDLMDTIKSHGYLRSAMGVVGRATVGAWWTLRKRSEYKGRTSSRQLKRLQDFYLSRNKAWDNIKDFQNMATKLTIASMYLRYFGQAAFQITRDAGGNAVGMDFLYGLVVPNVDKTGKFKSPAFVQYLSRDVRNRVEYKDPRDIVFIINPDWEGSPMGSSDIESLTSTVLPIDLYLQVAAREYMKNRNTPEVVYRLSEMDDDAFNQFVRIIEERHSGAVNLGRNPIVVSGEFDVKELRPLPSSLPYQESRKQAREEELAAAGVPGAKLGISESLSAANLREARREFHETTMMPLFKMIETALYEQVHVREFGIESYEFIFDNPDFLTLVERATVDMRYIQNGVWNPNEVRYRLGDGPRKGGDEYADHTRGKAPNNQGSPPEGRETEPDDPAQVGEPTDDDQDPVRGDQHNEEVRQIVSELRRYKRHAVGALKKGRRVRSFNGEHIPQTITSQIKELIDASGSIEAVASLFDDIVRVTEEMYGSANAN